MIDPELLRWIQGYKSKGYTLRELADYLANEGYSPVDINDTIKSLTEPGQIAPQVPMKVKRPPVQGVSPPKKINWILFFLLIMLFAVICVFAYVWWSSSRANSATSTTPSESYQQQVQSANTTTNVTNPTYTVNGTTYNATVVNNITNTT